MKIISPGQTPAPEKTWWTGVPITCPKCNAVFELEESDWKQHVMGIALMPPRWIKVICPNTACSKKIIHEEGQQSPSINPA